MSSRRKKLCVQKFKNQITISLKIHANFDKAKEEYAFDFSSAKTSRYSTYDFNIEVQNYMFRSCIGKRIKLDAGPGSSCPLSFFKNEFLRY